MTDDQVLVRCLRGQAGPTCPEDGVIVKLPADVADELVRAAHPHSSGQAIQAAVKARRQELWDCLRRLMDGGRIDAAALFMSVCLLLAWCVL